MIKLNEREIFAVFIDSFEGIEYKYKKIILERFSTDKPTPKGIEEFCASRGIAEIGRAVALAVADERVVKKRVENSLSGADGAITFFSEDYPSKLLETPIYPLVLYYKGDKSLLKADKTLAIVGSRKILPQYAAVAEEISSEIARSGVVVATGIADGGDSAAIKGALKSGKVISVLAGGVYPVYPRGKQNLADEIARKGLLVSESPCGVSPKFFSYPIRNRIIAALSDVVLIVGGDSKSGARHTAEYACEYGKDVACLPYGIGVKSGELCKSLVKNGAALAESAEEVAFLLGVEIEKERAIELVGKEKIVYEAIKQGFNVADAIAEKTGEPIYSLMATMASLEIKKAIVKSPDGRYEATK